jgi:hypothetical protein
MNPRIFACVFPTGISYADRLREEHGDYARLAFLSYATLQLEFSKTCPAQLKEEITESAAKIQAQRGSDYQVSTSGQTVRLGSAAA